MDCADLLRHEFDCRHQKRWRVAFSDGCQLEFCDACWWAKRPFAWRTRGSSAHRMAMLDDRGIAYGEPWNAFEILMQDR